MLLYHASAGLPIRSRIVQIHRGIISIDPDGCVDIDDVFEIAQVDENTIALAYISRTFR